MRFSPWLLAAVGVLLEAAATAPFALVDLPELSVALAILISAAVAFVVGPRWGLLVAAIGSLLVFLFPAHQDVRALAALPVWLALAAAVGMVGDRLRAAARDRRLAASEVDAFRADPSQALVELDLDGRITGWSRGAREVYGYDAEEVAGEEIALLTNGAGAEEVREALGLVREGDRKELERLHHRRKDGDDALVSLSLAPISDGGRVVGACAVIHDETEQRRLRETVEEGEAKYRALAEGLPLVTWLSAPDDPSSSIYVSGQIESLLGYSTAEWRDDPELFSNVLHPDDRERVLERRKTAVANGGAPIHDEYRLISRAGVVVWVREHTTLLRDGRGEPLYLQTFLLDVGERKRAEQERERLLAAERAAASRTVERQRRLDFLREAGQLLSSLLDHASAIQRVAELAVRDYADWCVVDIVEEGGPLRRLATARGELLKHEARARPDEEPGAAVHAVVESGAPMIVPALGSSASDDESPRLLGGIEVRSALCVPLRARKRSLGALTLARTESQDVYGADDLALAEDLAARIAVAIDRGHLYREVEQRADAARVLQHVADGVLLLDRNGIVRLWNPAAEAITSIRAEDVVGHPAGEVIPGWRDSADSVPVSETPDPGHAEVVIPIETEIGERWISISGVEFFGGTVYAFRDLTEIRHIEELKADFIATASHELRTPLAAVYGAAQTLLRHDFALDEGGRDRFVSLIAEESDRLGRIVNEILLANQLEAGRLDLGIEPFDPVEIVERVVEATRAYAPPEIAFEVRTEGELPRVAGDRDKVRQVLVNLIENAIKYSPDGGRIELGVEAVDSDVRFSVKDEGLGIPPEEQARVFEKFYRLDPQMTRGVGGTGLGLYICHELVSRMGGRIWVEANEDRGSTFFFELPAEDLMARQLPEAIEAQARNLASRT
ncbi:MAG TPA: PAS domain S-box protein [Gaiellaceae bacterium]|nr:PAS domain S-box protein [Gaiellaceae bacterium]